MDITMIDYSVLFKVYLEPCWEPLVLTFYHRVNSVRSLSVSKKGLSEQQIASMIGAPILLKLFGLNLLSSAFFLSWLPIAEFILLTFNFITIIPKKLGDDYVLDQLKLSTTHHLLRKGLTALMTLSQNDFNRCLKLLSDENKQDIAKALQDFKPTNFLFKNSSVEQLNFLLSVHSDVNYSSSSESSLLCKAVSYKREDLVAVLLKYGADFMVASASSVTPLEMAVQMKLNSMVETFLSTQYCCIVAEYNDSQMEDYCIINDAIENLQSYAKKGPQALAAFLCNQSEAKALQTVLKILSEQVIARPAPLLLNQQQSFKQEQLVTLSYPDKVL
jgi:ankyrin repeat protein